MVNPAVVELSLNSEILVNIVDCVPPGSENLFPNEFPRGHYLVW